MCYAALTAKSTKTLVCYLANCLILPLSQPIVYVWDREFDMHFRAVIKYSSINYFQILFLLNINFIRKQNFTKKKL